jgi:3-oxoacyl-[acyl-carrier-protein] synthase III
MINKKAKDFIAAKANNAQLLAAAEKQKSEYIKKIDKKLSWSQKDIARFQPHTAFLKIIKSKRYTYV